MKLFKKRYEILYTNDQGKELVEQFENMDEVRRFYKERFPDSFTTVYFKSLKTGRTVE